MDVIGRAQFTAFFSWTLTFVTVKRRLSGILCLLSNSCLPNSFPENSAAAWDRGAELPEGRAESEGRVQITEERLSRCVDGGRPQQY